MTDFIFNGLTQHGYRAILADPPWTFRTFSEAGQEKSPQAHYVCMEPEHIYRLPVQSLAHPEGCLLVLWGTAPMIEQAFTTVSRWGFTYKTMGAWAKQGRAGGEKWAFGTGFLLRSAAEFWLVATRGRVPLKSRSVRNLLVSPVREHSRKPDEMRQIVEALSDGPYLELFARERAPGWDAWGNEVGKFDGGLLSAMQRLGVSIDKLTEAMRG